jgi:hypothetical protein
VTWSYYGVKIVKKDNNDLPKACIFAIRTWFFLKTGNRSPVRARIRAPQKQAFSPAENSFQEGAKDRDYSFPCPPHGNSHPFPAISSPLRKSSARPVEVIRKNRIPP